MHEKKDIWFDQREIVWGDDIISEINNGLSTSFMGIVVLSNNFFERAMPKLELNSMILLMNTANHQELLLRHPLLAGIRGERADQDCDALVLKLEAAINKTNELLNSAIGRRRESILKSSKIISDDKKEVEQNEIESILTELQGTQQNIEEMLPYLSLDIIQKAKEFGNAVLRGIL
ncbi:MAG: hypothetical protein ACJ72Q_04320 [Nitrososphaeraceae archaeon]